MRKIHVLIGLIMVVALLVGACQPAPPPEDTPVIPTPDDTPVAPPPEDTPVPPPDELEVTTLRLGFGVDPVFAPHIIAIEKGWFEDAGFTEIDTITFTAGALAGEALAAGEIELWTPGNVPPISMRHAGLPIIVLGTNTLAYIEKFVMRTDVTLETPEDLYNIRIGLLEGSTASAVLNNIAEEYGLDITQMQVVNLPPPEQMTSIINNEIQAFIVWNPWPYLALTSEDVDVKIMHDGTTSYFPWDEGQAFQTSFTRSLWVASEQFVRDNPIAAQAMMEVLLRAQEYVRDPNNRAEVVRIISAFMDQPEEQNQALWDDYNFDTTFDNNYVRDMQEYTDFLFEAGRIMDPQEPLSYTYTQFVEDYYPNLVVVPGEWQP